MFASCHNGCRFNFKWLIMKTMPAGHINKAVLRMLFEDPTMWTFWAIFSNNLCCSVIKATVNDVGAQPWIVFFCKFAADGQRMFLISLMKEKLTVNGETLSISIFRFSVGSFTHTMKKSSNKMTDLLLPLNQVPGVQRPDIQETKRQNLAFNFLCTIAATEDKIVSVILCLRQMFLLFNKKCVMYIQLYCRVLQN